MSPERSESHRPEPPTLPPVTPAPVGAVIRDALALYL